MSSPATTNITIGSILELLAPTTVAPRDANERPVFDELLQPPKAPPPPPDSRFSESQQWPQSRDDAANDSSGSIAPPSAAAQQPAEDAQPDKITSDEADDAFAAEQEEGPQDDPAPEVITAHEKQLAAEALAGAVIAAPLTLLADTVEIDESRPEAPSVDAVAPSAARRHRGKQSTATPLQTAGGNTVTDKSVPLEATELGKGEPSGKDVKRRAAGRRQEGPPTAANGQANDPAAVPVDAGASLVSDISLQEATAGFEGTPQIQLNPAATASALTRDDHKPAPETDASTVTVETPTSDPKLPDQPTATSGIPSASAVAAPTVAPNATNVSTSPGDSPAPIGSSPSTNARSRLPREALADGFDGVRRHSRVEIDTTRLLSRVTRAFQAAQQRDGELRLRLSPPELGSLRLLVHVQDGVLVARLETETSAARTAIIDNLPALRERLAEQGVRVERFDVDLMQQQSGGMPDRPRDQERDAAPPIRTAAVERPRGEPSISPRSPATAIDPSGRLNVII